jgi:hypothetical protein
MKQSRAALPDQTGSGAGRGDEGKVGRAGIDDANLRGKGRRQAVADPLENCDFALAPIEKTGEGRFGR